MTQVYYSLYLHVFERTDLGNYKPISVKVIEIDNLRRGGRVSSSFFQSTF